MGWGLDSLVRTLRTGSWVTKNLFDIPFSPLYGLGAMLLIATAHDLKGKHVVLQFVYPGLILTGVELVSGWILVNWMDRRLWDYSDAPLNIAGHTDITHALAWGLLGFLFIHCIHPFFERLLKEPIRSKREN